MPERKESTITFKVKESIWFERGQEVDELISISLSPHIEILDEDDYVVLKGTLELSGEYKHSNEENEDELLDIGRQYIQSVEMRNELESEFFHQLPLDITIPRRKINNLEEISVEIDSFDYKFPENCRLQLLADVGIRGVYEDIEPSEDMIDSGEDTEETPANPEEASSRTEPVEISEENIEANALKEEVLQEEREEIQLEVRGKESGDVMEEISEEKSEEKQIEARNEVVEETRIAVETERVSEEIQALEEAPEEIEASTQEEESAEVLAEIREEQQADNEEEAIEVESIELQEVAREDEWKEKQFEDTSIYDPFKVEANIIFKEKELADVRPTLDYHLPKLPEIAVGSLERRRRDYMPSESSQQYMESSSHMNNGKYDEESSSHSHKDNEDKNKVKKKKDKYKSMSFSDFFARKEDESAAKLKVCFVQTGDSIQELADKYKVSVQQILRANQLEANHEVFEGQVLYIPVKVSTLKSN